MEVASGRIRVNLGFDWCQILLGILKHATSIDEILLFNGASANRTNAQSETILPIVLVTNKYAVLRLFRIKDAANNSVDVLAFRHEKRQVFRVQAVIEVKSSVHSNCLPVVFEWPRLRW